MRRGWRSVGLVVFKEAWNMPLSLFYNWSPARRAIAPRIAVWFCIVMGLRILVIETAVSIMKFSFSFPYCGKFSCPVAPLHLSSSMYQHRIVTLNRIKQPSTVSVWLFDDKGFNCRKVYHKWSSWTIVQSVVCILNDRGSTSKYMLFTSFFFYFNWVDFGLNIILWGLSFNTGCSLLLVRRHIGSPVGMGWYYKFYVVLVHVLPCTKKHEIYCMSPLRPGSIFPGNLCTDCTKITTGFWIWGQ